MWCCSFYMFFFFFLMVCQLMSTWQKNITHTSSMRSSGMICPSETSGRTWNKPVGYDVSQTSLCILIILIILMILIGICQNLHHFSTFSPVVWIGQGEVVYNSTSPVVEEWIRTWEKWAHFTDFTMKNGGQRFHVF